MKKAVFLDRDGVINEDKGYVSKIENFVWCDGVFEALLELMELGFSLFIVTNQSGIGRGYYTLSDFERLNSYMLDEFSKRNIEIKKVYFCPHAPEQNCSCRKPSPQMILRAAGEFDIDLLNSILVGDKNSDIEAGKAAKIGRLFKIGDEFSSLKQIVNFLKNSKMWIF